MFSTIRMPFTSLPLNNFSSLCIHRCKMIARFMHLLIIIAWAVAMDICTYNDHMHATEMLIQHQAYTYKHT